MANLALELEVDLERHESPGLVWYRAHASTVRGLLSLVVVGLVWEIAGRTGRWPLILAPISDIWIKFLQLAGTGELQRHILVSLNEFFVGFALAAVLGILLGIIIASRLAPSTMAASSKSTGISWKKERIIHATNGKLKAVYTRTSPDFLLIKPNCCNIKNSGTTNATGGIIRGANTQKSRFCCSRLAKRARE